MPKVLSCKNDQWLYCSIVGDRPTGGVLQKEFMYRMTSNRSTSESEGIFFGSIGTQGSSAMLRQRQHAKRTCNLRAYYLPSKKRELRGNSEYEKYVIKN
jgi:hypothetical protein